VKEWRPVLERSRASRTDEGRVSRVRRTPLQDVVAGPSAEQDSGAQRPNGPAYGEYALPMLTRSMLAHERRMKRGKQI
jgi:hypothetical protein